MRRVIRNWGRPLVGVAICAIAALVGAMTVTRSWRAFLPFIFVAVVVMLAVRYGLAVSILGSAVAALVFAYFFPPVGSLRVAGAAERANLGWMLLGSVAISYLLVPPSATHHK